MPSLLCAALALIVVGMMALPVLADPPDTTVVTNAPADALSAKQRLRVAPGLKLELWASEPLSQNITSVAYDNQGRAYVVESGRRRTSVFDIRGLTQWLDDDLALRSETERAAFLRAMLDPRSTNYPAFVEALTKSKVGGFQDFNRDGVLDWRDLEVESERIRLVTDTNGDGHADIATTFADGFSGITSGVAAGVLAEGTNVWFACIPDLWRMPAAGQKASGPAGQTEALPSPAFTPAGPPARSPLLSGFGVHIAFGGHDLHGLIKGPDGRIYFSIADRGTCVTNREGKVISLPDTGAIFRCEPDGANFEVFAQGLRNPQELAFDDFGNLWTADNNGDGGDKARWTLVLEGADYGWTIGWQWLPKMGAWNSERLWHTRESNTAAYIVPPVAHIGHGPAGIAHYPGTGLGERYRGHFFYADFPGGIRHFRVEPDGAFFKVVQAEGAGDSWKWLEDNSAANLTGKLLWDLWPVDVTFPPFGGVIVADWVQGWEKTGKGRLWHVTDPALVNDPQIAEVRRLLAEGMAKRSEKELLALLGHRDQRVRLEAQWELAGRGTKSFDGLRLVASDSNILLARIHALWGIGQIASALPHNEFAPELSRLLRLLSAKAPEIRRQTAAVLGQSGFWNADAHFDRMLTDPVEDVALAALRAKRDLMRNVRLGLPTRTAKPQTIAEKVSAILRGRTEDHIPQGAHAMDGLNNREDRNSFMKSPPVLTAMADYYAEMYLVKVPSNLAPPGFNDAMLRNMVTNHFAHVQRKPEFRMSHVLALRRASLGYISNYIDAPAPLVVLEAARAINDVPIPTALPTLAALLKPGALDHVQWPAENGSGPLNFTRDEWRTWVLRRAVNAAFRLGGDSNATALAQFAARADAPESVRVEALEDLADWAQPPKRDKIVGLHRPLPARDPGPARSALASVWTQVAAPSVSTNVLLAALRAGTALKPEGYGASLTALASHPVAAVRAEVAKLTSSARPQTVPELITQLNSGSLPQQRTALANLADAKESTAVDTLAAWLQKLVGGQVAKELQLDVLEAAAKARGPRLTPLLAAWTNALPKDDPLARHRLASHGGDAMNGRKLFAERADWGCQRCHKLSGEGGDVGPDLTGLGRTKGRDYVLRAILEPNAEIAAGFETVVVERQDDTTVIGILKEETATELVIVTPEEGRVVVKKADVKSRNRGLSTMPDGLGDLMTLHELRDVIEALSQ